MTREHYELPCSECRVLTRVMFLRNASDLAPFAELVCPDCEDSLIADTHDDPACTCAACQRVRARDVEPVALVSPASLRNDLEF